MRILLINYEYPPLGGGAATASQALAAAMAKMGVDVTVLTSRGPGARKSEVQPGISVHRVWTGRRKADCCSLPEMALFVLMALFHLPGLFFRGRFDGAILFFGFPCGLLGLPLRLCFRVPYVVALRGGDVPGTEPRLAPLHRLLRPLRRSIYRLASAVTANSSGLRNRSLSADPHPVTVIPNGVDAVPFVSSGQPNPESPVILFVGRFVPQKNLPMLLRAFSRLPATLAQETQLRLVGNGPLREELEELTRQLAIQDRVLFPGWVARPQIPAMYRQASLLVLPSWYEGMSNVVLEGMAAALPVIATDIEGIREIIRPHETGVIIPPGAEDELARQMERLLSQPSLRRRLGENARACVQQNFTWQTAARGYLDLLSPARTAP